MTMVRLLNPEEWEIFRRIRLLALQSDPAVFSSTFDRENQRPAERWRTSLEDPSLGVFGVFVDGQPVGMTGIFTDRDDAHAAGMWGSWLEPDHRGRGLSDPMYEARISWARSRPELRRVVVSHRRSNEASRRANRRHGFRHTHSVPRTWPDGVTEDEVCYELLLRPEESGPAEP